MIISLILTTFFLDYVLILIGEYQLWSLLGLKGLTIAITHPYLHKLENLLENGKITALCQTNISLRHYTKLLGE